MSWDEEMIAAYVDGELEGAEAEAARNAISTDPAARALAERLARLNSELRSAFPMPSREDEPAGIGDVLAPDRDRTVTPFRRRQSVPRWVPMSAAASVLLAIGVGIGWFAQGPNEPAANAFGPDLYVALETLPSGDVSPDGYRPLLTFRDAAGRPCREFETTATALHLGGIACRTSAGMWDVLAVVTVEGADPLPDGVFLPSNGASGQVLDQTLDAIGAGIALSVEEELELLGSGWE